MTHTLAPETGYTSSPEERQAAWQSLCMAAHGVMWGRVYEFPFWDPEEAGNESYWQRGTRIKYLALPYYEMDGEPERPSGYIPVELRLLENGGSDSYSLYRLRSGDLELVWSDQETDVLLCEARGREVIDGLDANEMQTLSRLLDYETCIAYDPRRCYVNDEGALQHYDETPNLPPQSVA